MKKAERICKKKTEEAVNKILKSKLVKHIKRLEKLLCAEVGEKEEQNDDILKRWARELVIELEGENETKSKDN